MDNEKLCSFYKELLNNSNETNCEEYFIKTLKSLNTLISSDIVLLDATAILKKYCYIEHKEGNQSHKIVQSKSNTNYVDLYNSIKNSSVQKNNYIDNQSRLLINNRQSINELFEDKNIDNTFNSLLIIPVIIDSFVTSYLVFANRIANYFTNEAITTIEVVVPLLAKAITNEIKRTELVNNNEKLKLVSGLVKFGIWKIDLNRDLFIEAINLEDIHGNRIIPNETSFTEWAKKHVHPDDQKGMFALVKTEFDFHNFDYCGYTDQNEEKYFRSIGSNHNGILSGITIDVTDFRKNEHEATKNNLFLKAVTDGLNTAIIIIYPKMNRVLSANKYAQEFFKLSEEQLKKIKSTTLLSTRFFKKKKPLSQLSQNMKSHEEAILKQDDGGLLHIRKAIMTVDIDSKEHYVVIIHDISEQKAIEVQLAHAQKMESIGSLAAGIAHEINTPIQYVGDNLHFLQEGMDAFTTLIGKYKELINNIESDTHYKESVNAIKELEEESDVDFFIDEIPDAIKQSIDGANRVSTIVKAMKKFSHPGEESKTMADINEIIESTVIVAKNEWKYVADLETDLDSSLPSIAIFPNDISQVILNLVVNASHAIGDVVKEGEKGKITLKTFYDDNSVTFTIGDTGSGIKPENYTKIFNPFFTTKEVGKGTGQGLAMAYTVITEKHKGSIDFQSELGKGTTFIITLPRE